MLERKITTLVSNMFKYVPDTLTTSPPSRSNIEGTKAKMSEDRILALIAKGDILSGIAHQKALISTLKQRRLTLFNFMFTSVC